MDSTQQRTLKRESGQYCPGALEGLGRFLKVLLRSSLSPESSTRHQADPAKPCTILPSEQLDLRPVPFPIFPIAERKKSVFFFFDFPVGGI